MRNPKSEPSIDLEAIRSNAEDGLDPVDALIPEEALARILVLLSGRSVTAGYKSRDIQRLVAWEAMGHAWTDIDGDPLPPQSREAIRDARAMLERRDLIRGWA